MFHHNLIPENLCIAHTSSRYRSPPFQFHQKTAIQSSFSKNMFHQKRILKSENCATSDRTQYIRLQFNQSSYQAKRPLINPLYCHLHRTAETYATATLQLRLRYCNFAVNRYSCQSAGLFFCRFCIASDNLMGIQYRLTHCPATDSSSFLQ